MKGGRGVFKEILVGGIKFKFLKNNRKKKTVPSGRSGPDGMAPGGGGETKFLNFEFG